MKTGKCIDCGQPCDRHCKRCLQCHRKYFRGEAHPLWQGGVIGRNKRAREKGKHPCSICEKIVWRNSKMCNSCANKLVNNPKKYPNTRGRIKVAGGYLQILKPEHHRANKSGYVLEHIYIWEESNQKQLPLGWIIHHLNGIKNDNRPRNLVALPNKKHKNVLASKAKRIQELEALLENGQHQFI